MKNLIEEIEKEMIEYGYEKEASFNAGLAVAINILTQYNIITAPKQIKLSEVLDRLTNELKDYVVRYVNNSGITICQDGWCYAVVYIDEDTHNFEFEMQDRFNFPKWLYELWIAGTEIVDDMEGK